MQLHSTPGWVAWLTRRTKRPRSEMTTARRTAGHNVVTDRGSKLPRQRHRLAAEDATFGTRGAFTAQARGADREDRARGLAREPSEGGGAAGTECPGLPGV